MAGAYEPVSNFSGSNKAKLPLKFFIVMSFGLIIIDLVNGFGFTTVILRVMVATFPTISVAV